MINQYRESIGNRHIIYSNTYKENIITYSDNNLFNYIFNSVEEICKYLNINTEIIISSTVEIDHSLKGRDKVIAFFKKLEATDYYNAIGDQNIYTKDDFKKRKY